MLATNNVQQLLDTALDALRNGENWKSVLDGFPVPVYTTDADGAVTYWNRACAEFAGREPELGQDRWCVTWKIYTTSGEFLPHDQCPMADAIKEKREIRGRVAVAMRPDGTRRAFTPYPTPLFDESGKLTGAVNLLIDVTDEQVGALADQAARCKRLARATNDRQACEILSDMARNYADTADALRSAD